MVEQHKAKSHAQIHKIDEMCWEKFVGTPYGWPKKRRVPFKLS